MVDPVEIERIWTLLQKDRRSLQPTPLLHWFAVGGGNRAGDYASSPGELIQAARTCQAMGMNFYLQLNPSTNRVRMRARSEDVTHWMYLLMDVDPKEPNADPCLALLFYMLGVREGCPHVIYSGRGYQAWFPFDPMPVVDRIPGSIPAAHAWWIEKHSFPSHGCVLDSAVSDLPRIMRCPGTTNTRTGRMARIIREGTTIPDLGIRALGDAPMFTPPTPPQVKPGRSWQTYIPHLTFSAMRFLGQGAAKGERHNEAVKAIKSLFEHGCEEDQAREALRWGSQLSEERLGEEEIEQIVRSVYR